MLLDSTRNIVGQPNVKPSFAILKDVDAVSCRHAARRNWLRGRDLNPRPSGYEPDELPGCSTPRLYLCRRSRRKQIEKAIIGQDDLGKSKDLAPAVGFGASFPLFQRDLSAFYLSNQATSATTRTGSFTAICWQFCWQVDVRPCAVR
jgi:hypothetical protein